MESNFTDIDFHNGLPSRSFVDKVNEVRVNIGRPATVHPDYREIEKKYGGVLMGIQDCGMPRDRMDRMCHLLALNCNSLGIEILVTKSNREFDAQWYFFGDIKGLLKAARDELVRPPFSKNVHEQIEQAVSSIAG